MGKKDILAHSETKSHLSQAKLFQSQRLSFNQPSSTKAAQLLEAELKIAVLSAHSNVPLSFYDKLSSAIRDIFPDSKIALGFYKSHLHVEWCCCNLCLFLTYFQA